MKSHIVPLHLSQDDYSPEAIQKRIDLHINAQQLTGGKGFRQPPKEIKGRKVWDKPKKKMVANPRSVQREDKTRLRRLIVAGGLSD